MHSRKLNIIFSIFTRGTAPALLPNRIKEPHEGMFLLLRSDRTLFKWFPALRIRNDARPPRFFQIPVIFIFEAARNLIKTAFLMKIS